MERAHPTNRSLGDGVCFILVFGTCDLLKSSVGTHHINVRDRNQLIDIVSSLPALINSGC